jgi:8-oxo-dGTP pyrophosphatase MutT (NUDIX family)
MNRNKSSSVRKGIAAIIFRRKNGTFEFLIMHRILRWKGWEPLKGGIDSKENGKIALIREIEEEANIKSDKLRVLGIIPGAEIRLRVPLKFKKQMGGFASAVYKPFYLVEVPQETKPNLKNDDVQEHDKIEFVPYEKALKMLTYPNTRMALRKSMRMLSHKSK